MGTGIPQDRAVDELVTAPGKQDQGTFVRLYGGNKSFPTQVLCPDNLSRGCQSSQGYPVLWVRAAGSGKKSSAWWNSASPAQRIISSNLAAPGLYSSLLASLGHLLGMRHRNFNCIILTPHPSKCFDICVSNRHGGR